jgi:NADPH:quinone reductase-like Zn-dependent oxidoreductase
VRAGRTEFKAGDRVAYANGPIGALLGAEEPPATAGEDSEGISFEQAASMMLQG